MHQLTVAMLRGRSSGPRSSLPTEGTKVRLVYDLLYEYRGRIPPKEELTALNELVKSPSGSRGVASIVNNLKVFWGCDIRRQGNYWTYSLVGEWDGKIYIDYTLEAVEQAEATR